MPWGKRVKEKEWSDMMQDMFLDKERLKDIKEMVIELGVSL